MSAFCLVLFVQGLTPLVERLVLRVNRCGVRFEGKQMGLQFLAVHPVIDCAELGAMEPLELRDQFGMRRLECLLLGGELVSGRVRLPGYSGILLGNRPVGLAKPRAFEHR